MSRGEVLTWLFLIHSVHVEILHSIQAPFFFICISPGNMFLLLNMFFLVNLLSSTLKGAVILLLTLPWPFSTCQYWNKVDILASAVP